MVQRIYRLGDVGRILDLRSGVVFTEAARPRKALDRFKITAGGRLGPVSDGMLGDSKLSPYPPCFNSSSTCRAISFSVSNTPFPWKAIASITGSSFRRNSLARASTGRTLGRSRLFNCST